MTQRKDAGSNQIPKFKDEAEAAAFWDTHSPLDFPEEFEEVQVSFARPLIKRGLTVKFSEETIQQLQEIAARLGIGPTTLVRMWVLERLDQQKQEQKSKAS